MRPPILADDTSGLRPPADHPPAVIVLAILCLTFACGMPLYQLREARRQAHQDLLRILAADRPDTRSLLAVFDRSNQNLDDAATGPCLILAFTNIFLVNQMLKLRRRYNGLAHDLSTPDPRQGESDQTL